MFHYPWDNLTTFINFQYYEKEIEKTLSKESSLVIFSLYSKYCDLYQNKKFSKEVNIKQYYRCLIKAIDFSVNHVLNSISFFKMKSEQSQLIDLHNNLFHILTDNNPQSDYYNIYSTTYIENVEKIAKLALIEILSTENTWPNFFDDIFFDYSSDEITSLIEIDPLSNDQIEISYPRISLALQFFKLYPKFAQNHKERIYELDYSCYLTQIWSIIGIGLQSNNPLLIGDVLDSFLFLFHNGQFESILNNEYMFTSFFVNLLQAASIHSSNILEQIRSLFIEENIFLKYYVFLEKVINILYTNSVQIIGKPSCDPQEILYLSIWIALSKAERYILLFHPEQSMFYIRGIFADMFDMIIKIFERENLNDQLLKTSSTHENGNQDEEFDNPEYLSLHLLINMAKVDGYNVSKKCWEFFSDKIELYGNEKITPLLVIEGSIVDQTAPFLTSKIRNFFNNFQTPTCLLSLLPESSISTSLNLHISQIVLDLLIRAVKHFSGFISTTKELVSICSIILSYMDMNFQDDILIKCFILLKHLIDLLIPSEGDSLIKEECNIIIHKIESTLSTPFNSPDLFNAQFNLAISIINLNKFDMEMEEYLSLKVDLIYEYLQTFQNENSHKDLQNSINQNVIQFYLSLLPHIIKYLGTKIKQSPSNFIKTLYYYINSNEQIGDLNDIYLAIFELIRIMEKAEEKNSEILADLFNYIHDIQFSQNDGRIIISLGNISSLLFQKITNIDLNRMNELIDKFLDYTKDAILEHISINYIPLFNILGDIVTNPKINEKIIIKAGHLFDIVLNDPIHIENKYDKIEYTHMYEGLLYFLFGITNVFINDHQNRVSQRRTNKIIRLMIQNDIMSDNSLLIGIRLLKIVAFEDTTPNMHLLQQPHIKIMLERITKMNESILSSYAQMLLDLIDNE